MSVLILSGTTTPQFRTHNNHSKYAERHGYDCIFDTKNYGRLPSPYFFKIASLQHYLSRYDWIFWLDDDAIFTQLQISLTQLVPEMSQNPTVIFCKSPINQGAWTYISSGNFLIRRCPQTLDALSQVMRTNLDEVKDWWDEKKFGMFTNGDQDAIVFQMTRGVFDKYLILDYQRFNTRPFHYKNKASEHFLCHFTHAPGLTKQEQMDRFCQKFGLSDCLLPRYKSSLLSRALKSVRFYLTRQT
jgi:hypothetical protein